MFFYKNGVVSTHDLRANYNGYKKFVLHNLNGPANKSKHGDYYWIDGEYIGYNLSKEEFDKYVFQYLKKSIFQ